MSRKDNKFSPKPVNSHKRSTNKLDLKSNLRDRKIVFSFRQFDRNQGQTFEDWQEEALLAKAMNLLRSLNELTVNEAKSQKLIVCYDVFPTKTEFYHPAHVPKEISWCRVRLQNKERIIGYFEDNVFYVVFLDKDHVFWITEKKNT